MKKKKALIISGISLVTIALITGFIFLKNGMSMNIGVYIAADDGQHFIVIDNAPVTMYQRSGDKNIFSELETGDRVFVISDGFGGLEPRKTGIYFLLKVGSNADIPTEIMDTLKDLE